MELKPYEPGHPQRNSCEFLRIPWTTIRRRKYFGHLQNILPGLQIRINIRIDPVQTTLTRLNLQRKTASPLVVGLIQVQMSLISPGVDSN
jgi:hypothetical protein